LALTPLLLRNISCKRIKILGETLLKKGGHSPNLNGDVVPSPNPPVIKVFGKEFEEKPFFKKVCLKVFYSYKNMYPKSGGF
jgi:hypothetical protein